MALFNTPFNVLDYAVLCVFILGTFAGYKQGFVLSFFKFFGYIISIVVTRLYYDEFVLIIKQFTPMEKWINHFYESHMDDFFTNGVASKTGLLKNLPLGNDYDQLQGIYQQNQLGMEGSIKSYLVGHLTTLSLNLVSLIVLFALCVLVLSILTKILDIATKLPGIGSLNKLGGLLFGFFKMFILLSIGLIIVVTLASLSKSGFLTIQLEHSVLAPYFMRYNILLIYLGSTLMGL